MATPQHLYQVSIVRGALEAAIRQLVRQPTMILWGNAGINRTPGLTELLCSEFHPADRSVLVQSEARVAIYLAADQGHTDKLIHWRQESLLAASLAVLTLLQGPQYGHLTGRFITSSDNRSVDTVKLVGTGMHRLLISDGVSTFPESILSARERQRWSRFIGALGSEATWQRLRSLNIAVVGAGRMGSIVITSLARIGVQHLTLVDPDRLEPHNLDAMDGVTPQDVGKQKVTALQQTVKDLTGGATTLTILPQSITALRAFVLAKEVDVLISCVDDDGARLATAIIATLYLKPLLDLGAGIFRADNERQLGADIRLILPGERCLLCFGNVANPDRARSILTGENQLIPRDWRTERAGSLRSLNQLAAHFGLRLLEDFISERVLRSTWLHLEFDPQGIPTLETITPHDNSGCHLCQRTGAGDAAVDNLTDVVNHL